MTSTLRRLLYVLVLFCHLLHASELFSPRNVTVDGFTTTTISLSWRNSQQLIPPVDTDFDWMDYEQPDTHFKVFYWRANASTPLSQPEHISTSGYNATLTDLTPGALYNIWLLGLHGNMTSDYVTLFQRTEPLLTTVLSKDVNSTTTDTLVLQYTANTGEFDHYIFTIGRQNAEPVQKEKGVSPRRVAFSGLTAGTTYTVSVLTVRGDINSQRQTHEFNTRPAPPIVATQQEVSSIKVIITKPIGMVNQYVIQCKKAEQGVYILCPNPSRTIPATQATITILYEKLRPHTNYQFVVRSQVNNDFSLLVTEYARTGQAAPGKVENFDAEPLTPTTARLSWAEPKEKNGQIKQYEIQFSGKKGIKALLMGNKTVQAPTTHVEVDGLKGGYMFTFSIRAVTVEAGKYTQIQILTPIGKPTLDPSLTYGQMQARQVNDTIQYDQFAVELVDPFSDDNGEVVAYAIVVTTDQNDNLVNASDLPYWSDNAGYGRPGTYQAIDKCADLFSPETMCGKSEVSVKVGRRRRKRQTAGRTATFVVGAQLCNPKERGYCNGRLSPATKYYMKLRGYNENGEYTDAPISGPISTATAPPDGSMTVLVTVIVVLCILFLFLTLAIVVVLYRRGIICSKDDTDGADSSGLGTRSWTGPNIRMSWRSSQRKNKHATSDSSRPIRIIDFIDHVKNMSADSDFGFSEEYEDLKPVGREQSCNASELACNRNKNRFTNILPYDHSRVKLLPTDDEEGTDYINANYMPGFNSKREFIVTQGPLPSTKDDFWRMVWEQNCRGIVMLTRCVEKGRDKCDHYWPIDSEPMFYGDLQVLILNETKCEEWIVTEFRISKGEHSRNIKHFHYIAWPDFGVPQQPQSLIRFVRLVRSKMPSDGGPIIAHCSAGVGRTGTYIAVDHLVTEMGHYDSLDVFGVVYNMRVHRPQMVQTEQQYTCIHFCLKCVIEGKENESDPYTGEDNDAFDESPTHNIYNTIQSTQPNDDDEGITVDEN